MQDWRDPMMAELKLPGVTKGGAWYKEAQKATAYVCTTQRLWIEEVI
jgi:hypothetical protein